MKTRPKGPAVPRDRQETERQKIIGLLSEETLSSREISERIGVAEKDVLEHLVHVRMGQGVLVIVPAYCLDCGFTFRKREKLKGPGRCPVCRSEHIAEPLFEVRKS